MRLNRLFKLVTSICLFAVMGLFLTSCFVTTNTSNSSNVKVLSFTKVNNAKMSNIKLNNNNITTGSNRISATADVYGVVSFDTKNLAEAYLSSSFKGTLAEFAETAAGKNVTSNINNYKNQLENKLKADNIKYTLKDTYTSVLSGVSVLVEYQYLDTIRNYKFVKNVALSNTYSAPKEVSYDELLASLSGVTDETERKEIYENLENKLIDEDAVISPVYYTDKNSFVQNYVKGMQFPSFGSKYEFKGAYIQGK